MHTYTVHAHAHTVSGNYLQACTKYWNTHINHFSLLQFVSITQLHSSLEYQCQWIIFFRCVCISLKAVSFWPLDQLVCNEMFSITCVKTCFCIMFHEQSLLFQGMFTLYTSRHWGLLPYKVDYLFGRHIMFSLKSGFGIYSTSCSVAAKCSIVTLINNHPV